MVKLTRRYIQEEIIDKYHQQKGVFRKFFDNYFSWTGLGWGTTKGIRELDLFIKELKQDEERLSVRSLQTLVDKLASRWERLKDRDDQYYSKVGKKKLTNQLFWQLAKVLEASMPSEDQRPFFLSPTVRYNKFDNQQSVNQSSYQNIVYLTENGKDYLVDTAKFGQDVTIQSEFVTPYDHERLSDKSLRTMVKQAISGSLLTNLINWFQDLKLRYLTASQRKQPISKLISTYSGEIISIDAWLSSCSLNTYSANQHHVLRQLTERNGASTQVHEQMQSIDNYVARLKPISSAPISLRNIPVVYLFKISGRYKDLRKFLKSCTLVDFNRVKSEVSNVKSYWDDLTTRHFEALEEKVERLSKIENYQEIFLQETPLSQLVIDEENQTAVDISDYYSGSDLIELTKKIANVKSQLNITSQSYTTSRQLQIKIENYVQHLEACDNVGDFHAYQVDTLIIIDNRIYDVEALLDGMTYESMANIHNKFKTGLAQNPTSDINERNYLERFNRLSDYFVTMKELPIEKALTTSPLEQLVIINQKVMNLPAILKSFTAEKEDFGCGLNHQDLKSLYRILMNQQLLIFVTSAEKQLIQNTYEDERKKLGGNQTLLEQDSDLIPAQFEVTLSSGQIYDARLLLRSFTLDQGFIEPISGVMLSTADIKKLKTHAVVGKDFTRCQAVYSQWQTHASDYFKFICGSSHRLIDVIISSVTHEPFDIYSYDKTLDEAVHAYLADEVSREDFIQILDLVHSNTESDIKLKQKLSPEHEADLEQSRNPIYAKIKRAVHVKTHNGFDEIATDIFWQLLYKEMNFVTAGRNTSMLSSAKSACSAIKAFDQRASEFISKSGYSGMIYFDEYDPVTKQYCHEYVVRRNESYGQIKGEAALRNVVNTFKGTFLSALRHNFCKEFFDRYDKGGICIGEKTRNSRTWALSLDSKETGKITKTMLETLAAYQDELTGSSESKGRFICGPAAVNWILRRHSGEKFIYKDLSGEETEGTINRDIITYYLAVYMADDALTPPMPAPECFQALERMAAAL